MHLPVLDALKRSYPRSELIVFSPFKSANWFGELGVADQVIIYERGLGKMVRQLRALDLDLIISFRPSSQWLNLAIGLSGARTRIGYRPSFRPLFTGTVPRNTRIYRPFNYLRLLEPLGLKVTPDTYFRAIAGMGGTGGLPEGPRFCLFPGGGAGEFKRWSIERFLAVAALLQARWESATFVFILGSQEAEYVGTIGSSVVGSRSEILMNASLSDYARAIATSTATVGNDCGPSHIAQMMGVPYVGIFSDHDGGVQARIDEWFHDHPSSQVITSQAGCGINSIEPERVFEAVCQVAEEGEATAVPAWTEAGAP